jgi:hypothetical protein
LPQITNTRWSAADCRASRCERALVLDAYRAGLASAFTVGAVIAGLGFLTVLFLPERPLRGK